MEISSNRVLMPELTEREKEILRDALDGVALALLRSGEVTEESLNKITETKVEKFVYYGLKDRGDLPEVTHSWYLAGAKTDDADSIIGTNQLQTAYQRLSGPSNQEDGLFEDNRSQNVNDIVEDYAEFYESDLDVESLCFTRGEQLLLDFYKDEAVDEYRDLYVSCQKLRNELSELKTEVWKVIDSRSQGTTLAQFGQKSKVMGPNHYRQVANLISDIHLEMMQDEELKELLPEFRKFTDLLEDAVLTLGKMEVERIDETHLQMVNRFNEFFYHTAWKLPALVISSKTARGPRREDLKERHLNKLEEKRDSFDRALETLQKATANATLVPTERDYPSVDSEAENVDRFVRTYLQEDRLVGE